MKWYLFPFTDLFTKWSNVFKFMSCFGVSASRKRSINLNALLTPPVTPDKSDLDQYWQNWVLYQILDVAMPDLAQYPFLPVLQIGLIFWTSYAQPDAISLSERDSALSGIVRHRQRAGLSTFQYQIHHIHSDLLHSCPVMAFLSITGRAQAWTVSAPDPVQIWGICLVFV